MNVNPTGSSAVTSYGSAGKEYEAKRDPVARVAADPAPRLKHARKVQKAECNESTNT